MARVEPLRALHYDRAVAGSLQDLASPPYDVIDAEQRADLQARSPYNVVGIDLPEPEEPGADPYAHAAALLGAWRDEGAVVQDAEPAFWVVAQDYSAPDGRRLTRRGFFARVRVEDYGAGRIRAHERTHSAPKEDRLRLTRATAVNLSPVFSLYSDPELAAWKALEPVTEDFPFGQVTDDDGTVHRIWRVGDPATIAAVQHALEHAELLIADGHHRYETARAYAEEIGGEGAHRYVLMCLVALEDEGLTVFPTHRLIDGLAGDEPRQVALAETLSEHFDVSMIAKEDLVPPDDAPGLQLGYLHFGQAFRLVLKGQASADAVLADMPEPYRHLDTAVLEALILKGPLDLTEDDISHLRGLGYARSFEEALESIASTDYDVGFFLRGIPVEQVRAVAAAGATMPPKSTFFFPKVLTGLLFNPLTDPE